MPSLRSSCPPAAIAVAAALAITLPAAANAANAAADPQLTVTPASNAATALHAPGLQVRAAGSAERRGKRAVGLPVRRTTDGARPTVTVTSGASLRLQAGGRRSTLTRLSVRLTGRTGTVRGRIDGRTATVLSLRGVTTRTAADGTRSWRAEVRPTAATVRRLRTSLRRPRLRAATLGRLELRIPATPVAPAPTPAPAPQPTPPAPTPAPQPTPPAPEPAPQELQGAGAAWTVRSSWMSYLAGGGGTAVAVEPGGRDASGAFVMPGTSGTVDASGIRGTVTTTGGARFIYPGHYIDMAFTDLVFELDGTTTPRVTALYTDRNTLAGHEGDGVPRRIDLGTLDLSETTPEVADGQVTLRRVPLLLSAEAAAPFLYYKAGEPFGAITLRIDRQS